MEQFDHPLSAAYRQDGGKGRGPEVLVLRRGFMMRCFGVIGALGLVGVYWMIMDMDCAALSRKRLTCEFFQTAWPVLLYAVSWFGIAAAAGLLDPRPYLVLDAEGIRFRWAGFIPWSQVKSVNVPKNLAGKMGADYVLRLEFKDKASLLACIRRTGGFIQRAYFALQSLPLAGWFITGPLGRIALHGTGVYAFHLVDWIRKRLGPAELDAARQAPEASA